MIFTSSIVPVILCVAAVVVVLIIIMGMWRKIPQDKAAVVTGLKKRVITGGGTLVVPVLERVDIISLENIPLSISTTGAMTNQGVPIIANGVAVIKVKNDRDSILSAVEQFYTGREDATNQRIRDTVNSVLEGKLREIVGKMTVEGIYKDRETFSNQVREVADLSLKAMGFELIEFTIKEINDQNGYLEALGAPRIAEVKKDAEIAKAEADRDAQIKIAEARRSGEEARLRSEASIAEAAKEKSVRQSQYEKEAQTAKAEADAAYQIQENIMNKTIIDTKADAEIIKQKRSQEIATEEMQVEVSREEKNIELAKTKAEAKKRFLDETVVNPAEAARKEAELKAEAEKIRAIKHAEAEARSRELMAEAEANARKKAAEAEAFNIEAIGMKEADIIKIKGEAEALAIGLKLTAEADGMQKKAEAYKQYGEAAVIQMIIEALPQMAENIAKPMGNIDKILVWDGGHNGEGGAVRLAENITKTLAATFDSVNEITGFDVKKALMKLTGLNQVTSE
ncbi:MAG: SPFH domain-containing protein [Firmicutes bacterium]|nr:SPFH domain-containing protein [Bacillota bacterium]